MAKRLRLVFALTSILIIGVLFCFTSCYRSSKKVDPFYTNRGGWDYTELPLIKPYNLIILNGWKRWGMNMKTASMLDSITGINVVDNTILVHSLKTFVEGGGPEREVWAVVIPSEKIEKEFLYFSDYEEYLKTIGFKKAPVLHRIDDVAEYAGDNDIIDWTKIVRKKYYSTK